MPVLERQFSERFLRSAGRPALGCLGACFSYAELQTRVAAIAVQLRECGLVAGDRVGLHLARSSDLVAAVLACLREGLCFVPLEPEFPLRRLHAIATEAQLALVLQDEPVAFPVPTWRLRPGLSGELEWPEQDEGLPAYMMFTSGSTGRPKGVVIGRAALAGFLDAATRRIDLSPAARWLFITTPAFDISLLEMLGPLWVGGYVEVACAPGNKDPVALATWLAARSDLDVLQATPAFWRMLLAAGWPGNQRLLALCGGEALDATLAERLAGCVGQLWNCYGPTEATVWSMMARVESPPATGGVPLAGTLEGYGHLVLDEAGCEVQIGDEGELCIAGRSLAEGYWARDELTAAAFINHAGRRLYRTGDRVQWLGADRFAYRGRQDDQIKLRGFRIELGEVEAALRAIAGVRDAAVRLLGRGEQAGLVAYVVPVAGAELTRVGIRRALLQQLPAYMVPAKIMLLDDLPRTASGKIDRKRLPEHV